MSTDDLNADYARAGFGATLPFGRRPALVVVDAVQAYVQEGSALYAQGFVDALQPIRQLVAAARAREIPVIFTGVVYSPDGRDGGAFFRKVPALQCFVKGSPLGAFAEGLAPLDGETVVMKQYASAFFGTSLASTLTSQRIDTVLVSGFSTSGCVRATALDAMQYGFNVFVVREACGDRNPAPHEANLFDLQAKYAEVVSVKDAILRMQQIKAGAG